MFKAYFILFLADILDCGLPPNISNGSFQYTNTTFGSDANLQCNQGFAVNGSSTYTCENSETWLGSGSCGMFYFSNL